MLANLFSCCCKQQIKEQRLSSAEEGQDPEVQSQGSFPGGFRRGSRGGSQHGSTRSSTPSYTSESGDVSDAPIITPTETVRVEESLTSREAGEEKQKSKTKTKTKKAGHFWSSKSESTKTSTGSRNSTNNSKSNSSKSSNTKGERNSVEKNVSIKERIRAFEPTDEKGEVKMRDGQKPRKKKPTSKAFEEFETSGILIGFGNAPKRRISEETEEEEGDHTGSTELEAFPLPGLADEILDLPKRTNSRLSTDDEGIHTMDSGEEDEFALVPRNSELLKSFRRAPPPKNRTRARRTNRKRGQLNSDPFQDIPGLESPLEDSEYQWRSDDKSSHTSSRDNISEDNTISSLKTSSDSFNIDDTAEAEELPKKVDCVKIYRPVNRPCTENIRRSSELADLSGIATEFDGKDEEKHKVLGTVSQQSKDSHGKINILAKARLSPIQSRASLSPYSKGRVSLLGSPSETSSQRPKSFCYITTTSTHSARSSGPDTPSKDLDLVRSSPSTPRREEEDTGLRRWESELSGLQGSSVAERKAALKGLPAPRDTAKQQTSRDTSKKQALWETTKQQASLDKSGLHTSRENKLSPLGPRLSHVSPTTPSYSPGGPSEADDSNKTNSIRKMDKGLFNDRIRQWDSFSSGGNCPTPIVKHVERHRSKDRGDTTLEAHKSLQPCWSEYQAPAVSPSQHSRRPGPIIKFIIDKEPTQV